MAFWLILSRWSIIWMRSQLISRARHLNTLAAFTGINPSIERFATVIHEIFTKRLESFQLEALTVTIWEDDIAWTSYRTTL